MATEVPHERAERCEPALGNTDPHPLALLLALVKQEPTKSESKTQRSCLANVVAEQQAEAEVRAAVENLAATASRLQPRSPRCGTRPPSPTGRQALVNRHARTRHAGFSS